MLIRLLQEWRKSLVDVEPARDYYDRLEGLLHLMGVSHKVMIVRKEESLFLPAEVDQHLHEQKKLIHRVTASFLRSVTMDQIESVLEDDGQYRHFILDIFDELENIIFYNSSTTLERKLDISIQDSLLERQKQRGQYFKLKNVFNVVNDDPFCAGELDVTYGFIPSMIQGLNQLGLLTVDRRLRPILSGCDMNVHMIALLGQVYELFKKDEIEVAQ